MPIYRYHLSTTALHTMEVLRDYADILINKINTNEICMILRCEGLLKDSDLIVIRSKQTQFDKTKTLLNTLYARKSYKGTELLFKYLQREYEAVANTIPELIGGSRTSLAINTAVTLCVMCTDGDVTIQLTDNQVS